MIFDVLWTILLGIVGGIISSVIVSRVFLIQNEYQQQVKFVEQIIRRLGSVSTYFSAAKMVFEVSCDQDIAMQHEMQAKGFRTEDEYYAANKDKNWISKCALLATFLDEMKKSAKELINEISNFQVEDSQLTLLLKEVLEYLHKVSAIKEFTFAEINENKKSEQLLLNRFDNYRHMTSKQLIKLVLKDRLMIVLFVLMGLLIAGTIMAYLIGV